MANLQEILSIGQSGLEASKNMLQLASFNVANANTEGYSRQSLTLAAQSVLGLGVSTDDPQSVRNFFVAKSLVQSYGRLGFHEGQLQSLTVAETAINDLDGSGVGTSLAALQNALTVLASNPSGTVERQAVLDAAQGFGNTLKATRQQLSEASDVAIGQATDVALEVSLKSGEIAALNAQIKSAGQGSAANVLIDKRDVLVAQLGSLMDVQVVPSADGSVRLYTMDGKPLVQSELSSKVTVKVSGEPPDYAVALQLEKPDGNVVNMEAAGGELGGLIESQNEVIGPALHRLDQIAFEVMKSFNAIHSGGFGADGSTGEDFFKAIPADQIETLPSGEEICEGCASRLEVRSEILDNPDLFAASAVAGGAGAGDSQNVQLLTDLFDQPGVMFDNKTITEAWAGLTSSITSAVVSAQTGQATEEATVLQFENLLASETGVSVDEELVKISVANQAFEAASSIIKQTETMTTTLLSLVG